jgi:hypothetical protein
MQDPKVADPRCRIQDARRFPMFKGKLIAMHLESCIMHRLIAYVLHLSVRISIMNEATNQKDALNSSKSHQQSHSTRVEEKELCDRCHQPMFRMRAVYWCVNCGYKTDCCGS